MITSVKAVNLLPRRSAIGITLASLMIAVPAAALTVKPVVIDMTTGGRGMTQTIAVENDSAAPVPVELRLEDLAFSIEGLKGTQKDSGDLLAFPPQALIAPGQTQIFRIQYGGDPALVGSKHYYVTVAQVPVKLPGAQSAVQIVYNFAVLVNVSAQGTRANIRVEGTEIATDKDGKAQPVLLLHNDGAAYGYLSTNRVQIVARDTAGKELYRKVWSPAEFQQSFGYGLVAAGQSRRMIIPVTLPIGSGKIDAEISAAK